MQSYTENTQGSNIFQQIRSWRANRAKRITSKEVDTISSLRSDKTHSDEALFVIKCILVFVTLFTSYCAYLFYLNTFSKIFDPSPAWLGAVGLAIVTEAAKIFLLHRFLRSIFFGWITADWWSLGGWMFIGALAVGAYYWSIRISTDGMNMLATQMGEDATPKADLTLQIRDATTDIDQQIKAAQSSQSEAMGTKWKGKTTWRAQKIAGKNAEAIASLQEQRRDIVRQTMDNYNSGSQHREKNINSYADWIRKYGGYMEWVAAVAIFSIVFFERRLVFHFHRLVGPSPTDEDFQNAKKRDYDGNPVGNNRSRANQNGSTTFQNTSDIPDREPITLTGQNTRAPSETDADYIYLRLKRLKGWDDNFGKPGNKAETVARNMCQILNEIGLKMQDQDFQPFISAVESLLNYIQGTGFPILYENGFEYKYKDELINLCHARLPARTAA